MRVPSLVAIGLVGLQSALSAQQTAQQQPPSFQDQVTAARAQNATLPVLVAGAVAARSLKNFALADSLQVRVIAVTRANETNIVDEILLTELSSGGGINGAQRRFRELRARMGLDPQQMVTLAGAYPELLVGGELDAEIQQLSPTAADPRYRCTCYALKGWMHRVGGNVELGRVYADSLTRQQEANPPAQETPTFRAQRVRDLTRAGREPEARQLMQRALAMDRIEQLPAITQYRWAQAFSELREIDRMVEVLDRMLRTGDLVTVKSLEVRISWDGVRSDPKFQALLDRHRPST
jgi:hypothetical protein